MGRSYTGSDYRQENNEHEGREADSRSVCTEDVQTGTLVVVK